MRVLLFCLLVTFFLGCKLPQLAIAKKPITPGILKTQGFYYNTPDYWNFMLYDNGVFRGDMGAMEKNIESVIISYTDSNYVDNDYDIPYMWGLFETKNDSIKIEHWQSREWAVYAVTKFNGFILNDSTLLINHPVVGLDTFYFHYLPNKPDSLNKFIK